MKEQLKSMVDKWLKEADRLSDAAADLDGQDKYDESKELRLKSIAIRDCAIDALKLIIGL